MIAEFVPKPEGAYSHLTTISGGIINFDFKHSTPYECFMIGVGFGTYLMLFESIFLMVFGYEIHRPFAYGFGFAATLGMYLFAALNIYDAIQDSYKRHVRDFSRWKNENPI